MHVESRRVSPRQTQGDADDSTYVKDASQWRNKNSREGLHVEPTAVPLRQQDNADGCMYAQKETSQYRTQRSDSNSNFQVNKEANSAPASVRKWDDQWGAKSKCYGHAGGDKSPYN